MGVPSRESAVNTLNFFREITEPASRKNKHEDSNLKKVIFFEWPVW